MQVLFIHFIIEYTYCKVSRNSPLNEDVKGQISAYKLEGKTISFVARELIEVPNSWERKKKKKKKNHMAPENIQVVHLKLQMEPDVNFFVEAFIRTIKLKRPAKTSQFTYSKKSLSISLWIAKSRRQPLL